MGAVKGDANLAQAFIKALGFFVFTVLLGWWLKWDIIDVSWSIWVTNYAVSILAVCVESAFLFWFVELDDETPKREASPDFDPPSTASNVFFGLFLFAILMYTVVGVNFVVGVALNDILPLPAFDGAKGMFAIAAHAFISYWPFLLVSLIGPCLFYYKVLKQKKYKEEETQVDLVMASYPFVFRSQAFGLLLIALTYFSNEYVVYWVLLFFYFFPWSELWLWIKGAEESNA